MEKTTVTDAEYAVSNLETVKQNIGTYTSYAQGLCSGIERSDAPLYDKLAQAEAGLDCLIEYIKNIITIAKEGEEK